VPLVVSRSLSVDAVDAALDRGGERLVFLAAQHEVHEDHPPPERIHRVGCVGTISRIRRLSDGRIKILVHGLHRGRIVRYAQLAPYYSVEVEPLDEVASRCPALELEAALRTLSELLKAYAQGGKTIAAEVTLALADGSEPGRLADLLAWNLPLRVLDAQRILECLDPVERLRLVGEQLQQEVDIQQVQARIQSRADAEMSRTHREYVLREQLRAIQRELGDGDSKQGDLDDLRLRLRRLELPAEAAREAERQLRRLEQLSPETAEASVVRTYLDCLVELPWSTSSADQLDVARARRILDEDHYDLRTIKDRILEFLAVRKLREGGPSNGPILCLLGPPGVGKTSLGRSIARALGRRFVRVALGGIRDEAEIRGHRRTYVGAMPGRILQGVRQAGSNNPVFMLDEIDKLGSDFRGDPGSALLEVLDPEQNATFRDNYLNLQFDLSNVLFIATANTIEPIPSALRDRLEVIHLSGYSEGEKLEIADRYLVPKSLQGCGLTERQLQFNRRGLQAIVGGFTREAGLRELGRQISAVARKVALRIAEHGERKRPVVVTPQLVARYLGPPRYLHEVDLDTDYVGIATALAWTPVGGDLLHIEAQWMPGKGTLTLTGQLGDVMKESAMAALSYARACASQLGLSERFFADREIHIHVPAGAVPKDGPSAGAPLACALLSLMTGVHVRRDTAVTGEITLRGRVLPVGGIKEKLLAAARARLRAVVIPTGNLRDAEELPKSVRQRLKVLTADTVDDVVAVAMVSPLPRRITEPAPGVPRSLVEAHAASYAARAPQREGSAGS
jgi:ATP-dependent Lon protease